MSSQITKLGLSPSMRDLARQRLCAMIAACQADTGLLQNICEDYKLFRNRLNDYCPGVEYRRERELLVAVVADQGAAEICQSRNGEFDEASFRRLLRRIVDAHGFTEAGVLWALESWLLALGLKVPELEDISGQPPLLATAMSGLGNVPAHSVYDVFICYRRESAGSEALLIQVKLERKNVRAFVDLSNLQAGKFDRALLQHIADTPNFVLLLSKNALDRCDDPKDWLRQEVVRALKTDRNIIQVVMPGFEFPDEQQLPSSMRDLLRHSPRIPYSSELLNGVIDEIARHVEEEKQRRPRVPQDHQQLNSNNAGTSVWASARNLLATAVAKPKSWGSQTWKRLIILAAVVAVIAAAAYFIFSLIPTDYSQFASHKSLSGHAAPIRCIAFSPDNKTMASGGDDSSVVLWDVQEAMSRQTLKKHSYSVKALAFSPDGKILASGGDDAQVVLWNSSTGEFLNNLKLGDKVRSVAFSPDGKLLGSSDIQGNIHLWETGTWSVWSPAKADMKGAFAFAPNGSLLAYSTQNSIVFWNMKDGNSQSLPFNDNVTLLTFSPDGRFLAGSGDIRVDVWNRATGDHLRERETNDAVAVAFSPDGNTLASTDTDGHLYLWDVKKFPDTTPISLNVNKATTLSFSPNRKILALGNGNDVELWSK